MSRSFIARLDSAVAEIRHAGLLRTLEPRRGAQGARITLNGRSLINFTSNDYLGLAAHPRIVERAQHTLARDGFGAGAAALLSGRSELHEELEQRLAALTGMPAALLFSSGYLANTGTLPALLQKNAFVAHDRLNHASLIDAVIASSASHRRYPHASVEGLPALLDENRTREKFIITESVFSMDGDLAPLPALHAIARDHEAVLYVDDAHGFGVTHAGRGAAAAFSRAAANPTTIIMLTLGKALGSVGAAVLGPRSVIEFLVQRARTFIYDTALPAVCAAVALEALEIIEHDGAPGRQLNDNITRFRAAAAAAEITLMPSSTPIQALPVGDDHRAVALSAALNDEGLYVRAIRPPTVPRGTARLRIVLTAAHTAADIDTLVAALRRQLRP